MVDIILLKTLKLHRDRCWSIDILNDLLATSSSDRRIKLIDLKKYSLVGELDDNIHKKTIRSVAWRPHSHILAAGSFDSTISIWGKVEDEYMNISEVEMELLATIEGHESEIKSIAWSSDGSYLATCSRDKSVWIWEADENGNEFECINVLQDHSQDVKHVVWHPNLLLLASSSYDNTIRIWKEFDDEWECSAILNGHEGTVWCSDFEPSECSLRLCSGSDDGTVRIWKYISDGDDEEQIWIQQCILPSLHTKSVYSVCWNSDGLIASTGSDGLLIIYKEISDGKWEILAKYELSHGVFEVNVVKWVTIQELTLLITAGDDGCVNIWTLK